MPTPTITDDGEIIAHSFCPRSNTIKRARHLFWSITKTSTETLHLISLNWYQQAPRKLCAYTKKEWVTQKNRGPSKIRSCYDERDSSHSVPVESSIHCTSPNHENTSRCMESVLQPTALSNYARGNYIHHESSPRFRCIGERVQSIHPKKPLHYRYTSLGWVIESTF